MKLEKGELPDIEHTFSAEVTLAGINPYVDVPERVVTALGGDAKTAVLVKVTGRRNDSVSRRKGKLHKDTASLLAIGRITADGWFRTTLISLRSEPTRLYLDTWMRDEAQIEVGDWASVRLKIDRASRELSMPPELRAALDSNPQADAAWQALTPSRQREILTYLNFLKTPAALDRNMHKLIADLVDKENFNS